ncbi:hypothetical protein [Sphingomonas abaci]|uniref:Uncharacterized protein n=1 Tax=Sphingomonas abaci TaxID=237611 RepID=A0A7W7AKB6_9SPHN|nr:hypothetical protein [Sphingomonas abaci]MBB4618636.1 hypothetical protein [Sphingomonas abaci]
MTPPDPQQVAEIAGRLSKAQREWIASVDPFAWVIDNESIPADLLFRSGYMGFHGWVATCRLSPIGCLVRNFIKGNHHD